MPIIAGVDRSERAPAVVKQAADLADRYGVDLHVVHVANLSEASGKDEQGGPKLELDRARSAAIETAADIASGVDGVDEYTAVGRVGDAAHELITYSDEHDAEYIVVCGRKRSRLGEMIFGSVTRSLLLNANRPVVSVIHESE